ncbi:kinase [Streptomyces longispororuber]|uniref:Kinase n=1 Tax=Streptomyces longispororuber TaxID=68230 RepID=A0A918ZV33_9ACTN|nr:GHMP kinase [Streptomyces longispororuber]GHE70041.1 kinase [Streptomyces longispororuber]
MTAARTRHGPPGPPPGAASAAAAAPEAAAPVGTGHATCHHGEILQGVFLDERWRRRAGLVTLPLAGLGTRARFARRPGTDEVTVVPADRTKALRAATYALAECATRRQEPLDGGELTLDGDIPVGLGMGSSSSDVIAAVRAVADAYGVHLAPEVIARLAVRAERASDPLMLDGRPLLFAQREGRVLEELGAALPPALVVGDARGGGRPVDTLALPAPADDAFDEADVPAYERLRALLRRAVAAADPVLLGHVATESARLRQRVLPHAEFAVLTEIAGRVGAVGVQVAHSGNVAGLLFDPAAPDPRGRVRDCARALRAAGIPTTYTFPTRPSPGALAAPRSPGAATAPGTPSPTSEEPPHGRAHRGSDRPPRPDTCRRRTHLPAL